MRTRESCGVCNFSAVQVRSDGPEGASAAEAGEAGLLECHRWPPIPAGMLHPPQSEGRGGGGRPDDNQGGNRSGNALPPLSGVWPAVVAGAWCGEFAPKRQDYGEPGLRHYS